MRRIRSWSLGFCLLIATGCFQSIGPGNDGETHFLRSCDGCDMGCGAGLQCLCGVCTKLCDAESGCTDLSASAICVDLEEAGLAGQCNSWEARGKSLCSVPCSSDTECTSLGDDFACRSGFCRAGETSEEKTAEVEPEPQDGQTAEDAGLDGLPLNHYLGPCTCDLIAPGDTGSSFYRVYTYDAQGNLVTNRGEDYGNQYVDVSYTYDPEYHLLTKVESTYDPELMYYTHIDYDGNRLIQHPELEDRLGRDDSGNAQHFVLTYDEHRRLVREESYYDLGGGAPHELKTWTYDEYGNILTRRVDRDPGENYWPDGVKDDFMVCTYDAQGNVLTEEYFVDPEREIYLTIQYTYQADGRVTWGLTFPPGGEPFTEQSEQAGATLFFNDAGKPVIEEVFESVDSEGATFHMGYQFKYDCWDLDADAWSQVHLFPVSNCYGESPPWIPRFF